MTNARTATVTNTIELPGGSAYRKKDHVTLRLNVKAAFSDGGTLEMIRSEYVPVDKSTGTWSATLAINDDLDPAGTYYTVQEEAGVTWAFKLTAANAGQTVTLRSVLVDAPANTNPLVGPLDGITITNSPTATGQVLVITSLSPLTAQWQAGGTADDLVVTDNGDGTFTITGSNVVDNGDGTFTINDPAVTDNGNGTYLIAA